MRKFLSFVIIAALLLSTGCATAHRKITAQTAVLGAPQWQCSSLNNGCALVQPWEVPGRKPGTTAQLTSVGCAVHTFATFGHIAWECRNEKATQGRWLWQHK